MCRNWASYRDGESPRLVDEWQLTPHSGVQSAIASITGTVRAIHSDWVVRSSGDGRNEAFRSRTLLLDSDAPDVALGIVRVVR